MSEQKITFEYFINNATIERIGHKAIITLDDNEMVAMNIPDMTDEQLLKDCWEVFSLMTDSEAYKEFNKLAEEDHAEYMEELIDAYDQHSFIAIRYDYDEKVARAEYEKNVAEGNDQTYEEWIDDKKFQALEFETASKA